MMTSGSGSVTGSGDAGDRTGEASMHATSWNGPGRTPDGMLARLDG